MKETLALEAKEASKEPEKNDVASLPAQTNAQESPKEPEKRRCFKRIIIRNIAQEASSEFERENILESRYMNFCLTV